MPGSSFLKIFTAHKIFSPDDLLKLKNLDLRMKIFLLIFLATYGGMHILVFWGFYPLLKGHPALPTLTWIWMAGMIATPLLVRLGERAGLEIFARGLAWIGYSWMGAVFLCMERSRLLWGCLLSFLPAFMGSTKQTTCRSSG